MHWQGNGAFLKDFNRRRGVLPLSYHYTRGRSWSLLTDIVRAGVLKELGAGDFD